MKTKLVSSITIVSFMTLMLLSAFVIMPAKAQTRGPQIDMVRLKTVKSPDAELIAMQTEVTHFLPDMIRTGDIEKLDADGFTINSAPGFHMGHIGTNIRADQSYRTDRPASELPYVAAVLSDVNFRHAVLHAYDQDGILASIYKYIVAKSTTLVPNAQGGWRSPTVPQHPYNPGDPFASTVYNPATGDNEDSCSILRYGGYTFVDADSSGTVTGSDYWTKSGFGGVALPTLSLFTPTYEVAPTSAEHGARLITSLNNIGLNNMVHVPHEFSPYITKVYQNAEFDMYMIFWSLGRFPDHLYDMLHSSQDCQLYPWRYNAPGVNDAYVDERVEIIKESLNHTAKLIAAWEVQDWLYSPDDNSQALPYIQLYSRVYFTGANPDLRGIVNSPGYGADNIWTWLNWHWEPGTEVYDATTGKTLVVYSNGESPERLNPTWASTVYAWNVMGPCISSLLAINPYTHADLPSLADTWSLTETVGGMDVTFDLASGVEWQDGNAYTAEDAQWNMLFMRDNQIPRYTSAWEHITGVDVDVSGAGGQITVHLDVTSQFLLYDLAGIAAILPPPVWDRLDGDQAAILAYDPSTNTTAPTGAGPRFGTADGPKNQLYGTGPYIFQLYDPVGDYADLWANRNYFRTTESIIAQKTQMFHEAGDVNTNGQMDGTDLNRMSIAYGSATGDPKYDAGADVNSDTYNDIIDVSILAFFWGTKKEYP